MTMCKEVGARTQMVLGPHQCVPLFPQSGAFDPHRTHPVQSFESVKASSTLILASQFRAFLDHRVPF